ncbi:Efflux pump FUS6 [Lachnellula arida]|uniref:Efflux pump FUS6 n=1 Tax=Lachnellula arida TaxID=1316785 RepID=A0A8T9BEL8_9HELO|nr:Efflux pump FUS6 [Lachnellula arida]
MTDTVKENEGPASESHASPIIEKSTSHTVAGGDGESEGTPTKRGLRFWLIILALAATGLLSTLEGTIISTALPTIVRDIGGGELYTWAVNGYFLTRQVTNPTMSIMAFQPFYGQTANIFGRKWVMISAILFFLVGSAIAGGAQNMPMLIAGRAIQGIGGGGINMLTNLVISDIVPLRERGSFMAILYIVVIIATGMGPFIGGAIVQHTTWRWVFLLNLPIGGLALILVVLFLKVSYSKEKTLGGKLQRIDFIGNFLFVGSVISILIALTWGGARYSWSSARVIVPLVFGFAGMGAFHWFESSKYCLEPTIPPHLFKNRTSAAAFLVSFLQSLLLYFLIYYIPLYFQAVLGSTPSRSGVQLLPTVLIMVPFAAVGGKLLARVGRYRPLHHAGFALATIGFGCMTLLGKHSSTGDWVGFQALIAAGLGVVAPSALPAVLAPLDEKDVATATGTWSYLKSFGIICGITLPAVAFNNQFDHLSKRISDPAVRAALSNGQAYEHGTKSFVNSFQGTLRDEIIGVYSDSLKTVWQFATAIAGFAFLIVFVEKELKLRDTLNTKFGVKEKDEKKENQDEAHRL